MSLLSSKQKRQSVKVFRIAAAVLGISLIFTFASCSSELAATTTNNNQESTSVVSTYPVTVTDIIGRSIQIDQKPVRIVTLLPTATETLYKLGGTAIGRDSSSKYPKEVETLPTVGSAYNPNIEAVAALNPDLIIIEALSQAHLIPALEKLGAPVVAVRAASVEDVYNSLILVGQIIDKNETAEQAIAEIKDRIAAVKDTTRGNGSVLILISDANRNIYAAKAASYPGSLAALLGQTNPAEAIPDSGPYPGFGLLTGEQAVTINADVIFTISPAPPPAPKLSETLAHVPGFNQMEAVKNGKVKELDPVLFLQAQGPRIADALELMADLLNEVGN
jgi:iron complex transport system substrate-binding protein